MNEQCRMHVGRETEVFVKKDLIVSFPILYGAWTSPHFIHGHILNFYIQMVRTKTLWMPQGFLKDMKKIEC